MKNPAVKPKPYQIAVMALSLFFIAFGGQLIKPSAPPAPDIAAPVFENSTLAIRTKDKSLPFYVEMAVKPDQLEYGLMYRTQLAPDHGMLFIFSETQMLNMWMKNTKIPLDMLFIDKDGIIVHIAKMAAPESLHVISSEQPAKAVMEIAGGEADKQQIHVGARVVHEAFFH